MALTKAQLEARLTAILTSYQSGVLSVSHNGTSTTFRSLKEMKAIIDELRRQIDALTGVRRRTRYVHQIRKGL